ncbi:chorismate-binding protein [Mesonia sp. K7]|uniref:chorismate-binding protein n=1 Tax=Mesonia sp. K7 TaxID=2218606 RepID=UPI000DA86981|nr:chorismate-binding protein [Mesonia sp. K7]PZD78265.1 isochorismate synthase [Mesonia sp. K7]
MKVNDFFQLLQHQFEAQLPFVAYQKPAQNTLKALFLPNNEVEYVSDFTQSGFVFAPFKKEQPPVFFATEKCAVYETEILEPSSVLTSDVQVKNQEENKTHHIKIVEKAVEAIKSTDLKKVVLSKVFEAATKIDVFKTFQNLLASYPTAFTYVWYHPKIGLWMGATPEVLLSTHNQAFKTMALAGTQVFSENIAWSVKEIEEQAIVTDFIFDRLNDTKGIENLTKSETKNHRAGNIVHLKTDISGNFKPESLTEILSNLHPTPAVGGLPQLQACDYIIANENYQRAFYTGFLGEINQRIESNHKQRRKNVELSVYKTKSIQTHLFVNLRCMQVFDDCVKIYVGGGITADSNPEKEWEEICRKSETMLKIIQEKA